MDDKRESDQGVRRRLGDVAGPLRASDAERESALHALAAHYADGRLDQSEFDERADTALAARTQPELRALFTDLPGPSPLAAVARPEAGRAVRAPMRGSPRSARSALSPWSARHGRPGFPPLLLVPVLLALAVTAVIHGLPPFPLIPLLFILSRRGRRWNREARPWI